MAAVATPVEAAVPVAVLKNDQSLSFMLYRSFVNSLCGDSASEGSEGKDDVGELHLDGCLFICLFGRKS